MTTKRRSPALDALDWKILDALQKDARVPLVGLARIVGLSRPAVAERIERLERMGVIQGYFAHVNARRVGWAVEAFIRFRPREGRYEQAVSAIVPLPELTECHRVTGEPFLIMRVRVVSTEHLEKLVLTLTQYGETETSIILSSPLERRAVTAAPEIRDRVS